MKSIKHLLKNYSGQKIKNIKKIKFLHIKNKNVYNITAPFKYENKIYLIGRVESQKDDSSTIQFFKRINEHFIPDKTFQIFKLEDPSITKIAGNYVLSGVEIKSSGKKTRWRTVFYKGKDLRQLSKFATGPWGMKDIRLIELKKDKIGVFTRPQGKKGLRGKIGYFEISSLEKLKPRKISNAPILKNLFARGEWGGVNDLLILNSGKIGVLGHIANFSKDKNKFYYPIVFTFNPKTKKTSTLKIIGERKEFPKGKSKAPDLYNVIFPGGIIRKKNNTAKIYVGVADIESYEITVIDPFCDCEK